MELGLVISDYLAKLGCTAKALADAAGVSPIQLSRWRNGSRRPSAEMMERLASGVEAASGGAYPKEGVLKELRGALPLQQRAQEGMGRRLDLLLNTLKIRTSEIARVLNFDASYLSRIRSGKRSPGNIEPITEGVGSYIVRRCASESERTAVAELIGVNASALEDREVYHTVLTSWLRGGALGPAAHTPDVNHLLRALDSFDLNEYIRAIHIDENLHVMSDEMPEARDAAGLKNMMQCELDFLRATAISDSEERVLIYTDMPLTELAKDPDFPKQWMLGVADLLKKGLQVDMLHNVDRPFEELLLGLEVHIPMYMTGRITPYYLRESNTGPFRHLLEVSGSAALSGEAIAGHHAEGRYHLTFDPEELRYYHRRAKALMEKAAPLMDIYMEDDEAAYWRFREEEAAQGFVPVRLDMPAFRNVTVQVCHDRWAVVSKDRSPRFAFVIRHPKLVDAIERFAAPLVDE